MTLKENIKNYQEAESILYAKKKLLEELSKENRLWIDYEGVVNVNDDELLIGKYFGYHLILRKE